MKSCNEIQQVSKFGQIQTADNEKLSGFAMSGFAMSGFEMSGFKMSGLQIVIWNDDFLHFFVWILDKVMQPCR